MIVKGGFLQSKIDLPLQVENLNGKTFVFQIYLNEYNLKFRLEFYIFKKVFDFAIETDKNI